MDKVSQILCLVTDSDGGLICAEYVQVLRMLGNGRLEAKAFDDAGTLRLAHIRGKMRKKVW
jgi:initiation factor 1A